MTGFVLGALLAAAALALFWGYGSSGIILKLDREPLTAHPGTYNLKHELFKVRTEDGLDLEGWFVPAAKASNSTIVVLHGWGSNRSDVLPPSIFLQADHNLAYVDFRAHGVSGGDQTSLTCLEVRDFQALVRWLAEKKPEASRVIGALGFSMGAAVAISGAAAMSQIRAVVAESPFASYNATVTRFATQLYSAPSFLIPLTLGFAKWRLGLDPEECSPIRHIGKLAPRPVFIIQGEKDVRMPVEDGQALFAAAGEPKELWVVQGGDHIAAHDLYPEEHQKRVSEFFRKWLKA